MVEFVTLFLGLTMGSRPVEVSVDGPVAAVEIRLDGRPAARLDGPPWAAEVDFGTALEPHRIEAVALDAAGLSLDRVATLVNYTRSEYGAAIVLDPAPADGPRAGRVEWMAVLDRQPVRLEARLDGAPLAVEAGGRFVLPVHDPATPHLLEADLTFEDGKTVRAELSFGGLYGERVTSALTAVPVRSPPGRPWRTDEVRGWLERGGEALAVFTARAEPGVLVVLRDERMSAELRWLRRRLGGVRGGEWRAAGRRLARQARQAEVDVVDFDVTAVSSRPVAAHGGTFKLVRIGPSRLGRGLLPMLVSDRPLVAPDGRVPKAAPQKLWDALAVAGLDAALTNRPRAALLVLGRDPRNESSIGWRQARHYLASVRVPLYVWTSRRSAPDELGLADSPRGASGPAGLESLVSKIETELSSQTVVWLEGEHLPAEIALGAAAPDGVRLVR